MRKSLARTLRHLARLINPQTARTNAADAGAVLRRRRQDQEDVDEYLQARLAASPIGETGKGEPDVHETERRP